MFVKAGVLLSYIKFWEASLLKRKHHLFTKWQRCLKYKQTKIMFLFRINMHICCNGLCVIKTWNVTECGYWV